MPEVPENAIDRIFASALTISEPPATFPAQAEPPDPVGDISRLTQESRSPVDPRLYDSTFLFDPLEEQVEEEEEAGETFLALLTAYTTLSLSRRNRHLYTGEEVQLALTLGVLEYQTIADPRTFTACHNIAEIPHEESEYLPLQPLELPTIVEVTERQIGGTLIYTINETPLPIALFPVKVQQFDGNKGGATVGPSYRYHVYDLKGNFIAGPLAPQRRLQDIGQVLEPATRGSAYWDMNKNLVLWETDEVLRAEACA